MLAFARIATAYSKWQTVIKIHVDAENYLANNPKINYLDGMIVEMDIKQLCSSVFRF